MATVCHTMRESVCVCCLFTRNAIKPAYLYIHILPIENSNQNPLPKRTDPECTISTMRACKENIIMCTDSDDVGNKHPHDM